MDREVFQKLLNRGANSHKYDFGHVLVIGGSPGMVGAPFLAAMAALRVGAGLVTIASTPAVIDKLEKRVAELMTLRLSDASDMLDFIKNRKVNAVVIGPGLDPALASQLLPSLKQLPLPVVVDGGALAAVAQKPELMNDNFILTPHAGEFSKFFKNTKIQNGAEFAKQRNVTLVLKGNPTQVLDPHKSYINTTGGPALATAGTGDVLAGMIGGLLAQAIQPFEAAQAAVYLHGAAGDLVAKDKTVAGIASDVIEAIPAALKLVQQQNL